MTAVQSKRAPRLQGPFEYYLAFAVIQRLSHMPGSTGVCSIRTDLSSSGSMSSACRIVGTTCEVRTGVFNTTRGKRGLETTSPTLVSAKLMPPCSAFFLLDPV